ncbi:MAG TPA: hypothetical protein VF285_13935 [Castellaniella sp.]|uniref:hypothetical protein n=1 Tax=Castellaniella sp. TaxID=1955812 RepID=UPI002F0494DC
MSNLERQKGQILVLGMLLATVLSLAWLRYFATGQVTAGKARLVHGLDAAAYSGALVQARTLNLLSYVNRAQLAHQLAMGHLMTLGSWAHFGGVEADRLLQGNPPAHLIGLLFGADHGRAYLSAANAVGLQAQAQPAGGLGHAWAQHDAFVHGHLRDVATMLVRGLPRARLAAMQTVLQVHYPELAGDSLVPQVSADAWPGRVRSRPPDAGYLRFVRTLAARYSFLAPRNQTVRNSWPVDARCPTLRHELRRRGATDLNPSGRWQSGDTQSFHAVRSNRWIGCYYREYPMGWAWMPASEGGQGLGDYAEEAPKNFSEQDFWRWVEEATQWDLVGGDANPLANSYAVQSRPVWPSRGLAAYEELSSTAGDEEVTAASRFEVRLSIPGADGRMLHARSAAESYFSRPSRRRDGRLEVANLFRPYWLARLAPGLPGPS